MNFLLKIYSEFIFNQCSEQKSVLFFENLNKINEYFPEQSEFLINDSNECDANRNEGINK